MNKATSVVCVCETHEQVQRAMYNLRAAGVDTGTLSIASKDTSADRLDVDVDYYDVGDETFAIPGLGPLLVSGPLASWIVTAFDNGAGGGGASVVGAALATLGIAHEDILHYEAALKNNSYVLVVHGSPDTVAAALKVVGGTTHCSHTIHGEKVFDTVHGTSLLGEAVYTSQA